MSTISCTWKDCIAFATQPQLSDDGRQWACLCAVHARALAQAVDAYGAGDGVQAMLHAWGMAQGGAYAVAPTMTRRK